jgi:hypothetical protein
MRSEIRWDELTDRIGTAYQDLELFIATRDLRLAEAIPAERKTIFEEGTRMVRAMGEAADALL